MKLDIEPRAALDALAHHIDHQRAALLDADDRHTEELEHSRAEAHILREKLIEAERDVDRLTTALGEANAARIALREKLAAAITWQEPAEWPLPGLAPGMYTMTSDGDGTCVAAVTEDGRLFVPQDDSKCWHDLADVYRPGVWSMVRTTPLPEGGKA